MMSGNGTIVNISFIKEAVLTHQYPYDLPFFKNGDSLRIHPHVNFFVGDNGSGKSTLLEAIAVASGFNPEGGSRNFNFNTRESHSPLHKNVRISRDTNRLTDSFFLRSESFFNVATQIEILDKDDPEDLEVKNPRLIDSYGGRSLHEQSHGESFWALFSSRFGGNGLYILDEPEAALSPSRQLEMLGRIHELVLAGSQFFIATHSPMIVSYPHARVFEFDKDGIRITSYQRTKLFKTYQAFFDDPVRTVSAILDQHRPNDDDL